MHLDARSRRIGGLLLRSAAARVLVYLMALAVAAGCAGPSVRETSTARSPGVNLSGFPPAFRDGYADGCNSAKMLLGSKKDEPRFKSDAQYAQGWRDGYDICKKR